MRYAITPWTRLLRARRCIAALEFALVAPVLIMVLAGAVDLGFAVYTWTRLQGALAVGANFALVNAAKVQSANGDALSLATDIANLVATGNGTPAANVTVTVNNGPAVTVTNGTAAASGTAGNADSCYCPSGSPGNWSWGTGVACGSTPPACSGSSDKAGKFVTITASYSFSPFFPSYHFVDAGALTAGAAVQTR